jgi:Flp pilus assembly pilin Flp
MTLHPSFPHFPLDERGQALVEYAMVLGLIAITCLLILGTLGQDLVALFDAVLPGFA